MDQEALCKLGFQRVPWLDSLDLSIWVVVQLHEVSIIVNKLWSSSVKLGQCLFIRLWWRSRAECLIVGTYKIACILLLLLNNLGLYLSLDVALDVLTSLPYFFLIYVCFIVFTYHWAKFPSCICLHTQSSLGPWLPCQDLWGHGKELFLCLWSQIVFSCMDSNSSPLITGLLLPK